MNILEKTWNWIFPEGNKRLHALDVLRAIAIISVIIYHFPKSNHQSTWRAVTHFGYLGVDLFFVLSGYLIGGQIFNNIKIHKSFSVKTFYIKRFFRTLPSYYVALLLNAMLLGFHFFNWRYLFFIQNFGGLYYFSHSWSLCIEEHFYLFFPLIVSLFYKFKKLHLYPLFIISITVAGFIWRVRYWNFSRPDLAYAKNVSDGYEIYFKYIFYPSIGRLDGIAFGTLVAFIKFFYENIWYKLISKTNIFLFAGSILFITLMPFIYFRVGRFNVFWGFPLISFAFSLILISACSKVSLLMKVKIPGLTTISLLSYSLYLTHGWAIDLVNNLCKHYSINNTSLEAYLLMGSTAFCLALMLYLSVERPFLLLRHKILRK